MTLELIEIDDKTVIRLFKYAKHTFKGRYTMDEVISNLLKEAGF